MFFDFGAHGIVEKLAWTDPSYSNAWLVLDRNENGRVDDITELFGNVTPQPPSKDANGFLALAEYDKAGNGGNDDGMIDSRDAIYGNLQLWVDRNHNGISETEELYKLNDLHVARIDLQYQMKKSTDEYGNLFRYRSRVWNEKGEHGNRWAWDIFLVSPRQ